MPKTEQCILCGEPFTEKNPAMSLHNWIRAMVGRDGLAHYTCIARAANDAAYCRGLAPWDIGGPHPALVRLVESRNLALGRVFEPGPGLGDNAIFLATRGFDVTAVDISSEAIAQLQMRADQIGVKLRLIIADVIYELHDKEIDYEYVFERSFLQTLDPSIRPAYVKRIESLLKPGGTYIAIIRGPRNPEPISQPYAFTKTMLLDLLSDSFRRIQITPTISGYSDSRLDYWLVKAEI